MNTNQPRDPRLPDRTGETIAGGVIAAYALGTVTVVFLLLLRRARPGSVGILELGLTLLGEPVGRSFVSFVVMAILTGALIRRKRIAWLTVLVVEILAALWSVAVVFDLATGRITNVPLERDATWGERGLEAVGAVISIVIVGLLWRARRAFPARAPRGSWWLAAITFVVGTILSLAANAVMVRSISHQGFQTDRVFARRAVLWSLGLDDLGSLPRELRFVPELTGLLLSATIVVSVLLFLRSARSQTPWTPGGELAVRDLVARYGGHDSLSYFATRRDKSAVFSDDGRAAVVYATLGAVCLASSDPVGAREQWPQAIERWKAMARQNGWLPAVIAASEDGARAYAATGLNVIVLGDEAVVQREQFHLDSPALTPVRQSAARARRAGVEVVVRRQKDLEAADLRRLAATAERWRDGVERGFSMSTSRYGDPADGGDTWVIAQIDDEPVGVLTFVPWGKRGLSLDAMRRSPDAPNGVTELMVSELMRQGERFGLERVSLNFAVLRGVFADAERIGAPIGSRAGANLLGLLDRFFQLESLYRSNQKYRPEWLPRYICFDGFASLPRTVVAMGRAEGFLGRRPMPTATLSEIDAAAATALEFRPINLDELTPRVPEQTQVRMHHRELLRDAGRLAGAEPRPVALADAPSDGARALVEGRVAAKRLHGGVLFFDLVDGDVRRQVVFERDATPAWELLTKAVDLGDLLLVDAAAGQSRNGTASLLADDWRVAAKALYPVPFRTFTDPEARARNRSLDLLVHPEERLTLRQRSEVVQALRRELDAEHFTEVETQILGPTHGGATARPFRTYINAYNATLYLRIAPELALKRLLASGSGPIYEIARNFRNEGADASHNPEFTSLEAYEPYGDYDSMRLLTERLIRAAAVAVHGRPVLPLRTADGGLELTDISGEWPVISMCDAVSSAVGEQVDLTTDFDHLVELAKDHGIELGPDWGPGAVLEELYGELVEEQTTFPTFYRDFPVETSPLTGPHRSIPGLTERWDLVANGMEIGTAYSELVDPVEQRKRLTAQSLKAAAGDAEAMEVDEDFLRALELGLPPTGGLGLGVDRVAMLVTGTQIRDVLTFPFVRPQR